jgi:hypothetical protein
MLRKYPDVPPPIPSVSLASFCRFRICIHLDYYSGRSSFPVQRAQACFHPDSFLVGAGKIRAIDQQ